MQTQVNRRGFLRGALIAGACAGFVSNEEQHLLLAMANDQTFGAIKEFNKSTLPIGTLGDLQLSRLIAGGNIISGWCHQRDLLFVSDLAQAYLTPEKQFDTIQLMEAQGINAIVIDMIQLDIINKYNQQRGGNMKTIVAVRQGWDWDHPDWEALRVTIDQTIEKGADTLFLHGGFSDRLVESGDEKKIELLGRALDYIQETGYTAGFGSHSIEAPIELDKHGFQPDYYFKTFHHDQYWSATPKEHRKKFCVDGENYLDHNKFHDNIFDIDAEKTAAFMQDKKQPWIGFKILAAGAIPPESAFKFALTKGVDFVVAGMFDFQVEADVKIFNEVFAELKDRKRPWCS